MGNYLYKRTVGRDWQKLAEEYNNDGLNYFNHGDYEQAIELYNKAIKLEDKGVDDMAIGDFTQAITIKPKSKYYFDRGEAYEVLGDTENALNDRLKAAVSLDD